jgi:hypothetical protein
VKRTQRQGGARQEASRPSFAVEDPNRHTSLLGCSLFIHTHGRYLTVLYNFLIHSFNPHAILPFFNPPCTFIVISNNCSVTCFQINSFISLILRYYYDLLYDDSSLPLRFVVFFIYPLEPSFLVYACVFGLCVDFFLNSSISFFLWDYYVFLVYRSPECD